LSHKGDEARIGAQRIESGVAFIHTMQIVWVCSISFTPKFTPVEYSYR